MKNLLALTLLLILFTACGPEVYRRTHLKSQPIPPELKGRAWVLEKVVRHTAALEIDSAELHVCQFTFRFEEKGVVRVDFANSSHPGWYRADADGAYRMHVFNHKILYSGPESCSSIASSLSFIFSDNFKIQFGINSFILTGTGSILYFKLGS